MKRITGADKLIEMLAAAGYEAYYVGGCVRDLLRGEDVPAPADIDVTTSATPEEMKEVFAGLRYFETGIKHGTLTVLTPAGGSGAVGGSDTADENGVADGLEPIEITTFRTEGAYTDNRHPDAVTFVRSLEEDLARRDFTMNAMAMDRRGAVADPFGGREDLEAGVIRAVGDPDRRFQEDALRMLRGLRFAAVLSKGNGDAFTIEPETEAAIIRNRELLRNISAERIYAELKKLVTGPHAGIVIRRYVDVIGIFIPELLPMKGFEQHNPYHRYDVLEHCIRTMEVIESAGYAEDYQMKLAGLLHDVGKPKTFFCDEDGIGHTYGHAAVGEEMVHGIMNRLKADGETKERVCRLVKYHDLVFQEDRKLLKKWMNKYTPELLLEILHIKRADNYATGNMSEELAAKFDRIEGAIREILEEEQCFSLKDLAVNGRDIIAVSRQISKGHKDAGNLPGREDDLPGHVIGETLQMLLDEVIDGALPNEKEALTARAAELLDKTDF